MNAYLKHTQYRIDLLSCFICLLMMLWFGFCVRFKEPEWGLVPGCLGYLLARIKNRGTIRWFFLCFFFHLVAGIFLVVLRPKPKQN
ncbi:putative integral membrane protein [Chlamydia suis MD56]|nr:putative integral membrane protein [Chlamydia suis MD56]